MGCAGPALYYESHITIEPVADFERLALLKSIVEARGFRLAELLMRKPREEKLIRSNLDTFCTGHSRSRLELEDRMRNTTRVLRFHGFQVWRQKIEGVLLDERTEA